jgi:hypothetical protein
MFLVVPFLGVVAVTWRTVLRVIDQPGAGGPDGADIAPTPAPAPDRVDAAGTA